MAAMAEVFSLDICVKPILGFLSTVPFEGAVEVCHVESDGKVDKLMELVRPLFGHVECMKTLTTLGSQWWNHGDAGDGYVRGHSNTYIGGDNQIKMIPGFCECWGLSPDSIDPVTLDALQAAERNYHSVALNDGRIVDCSVEKLPVGLSFIHWIQRLAWKHIETLPFGLYGKDVGWWTNQSSDFPLTMHKSPADLFEYEWYGSLSTKTMDPVTYKSERDSINYKKAITTYFPRVWGYEDDEGHTDLDDCKVMFSPASLAMYQVEMPENDSIMQSAMNYVDEHYFHHITDYERATSIFGYEWRLLKDHPTVAINMSKGTLPSHYRECIREFHGDDYFTFGRASSGIHLAYVTRSEAWYRQHSPKAFYKKIENVQARFGTFYIGNKPSPTKKRLLGYLIPDYFDSFEDFNRKLGIDAALGKELIQWMGTHVRYICREDEEVDARLRDTRTATDWMLTL